MAIPKRNIRGLQHISTLSGSVYQTVIPYKAYMKLSTLEMEKVRKGKERESASKRVSEIDQRLAEIGTEKTLILKALGEPNSLVSPSVKASNTKSKSSPRRRGKGFKLRY